MTSIGSIGSIGLAGLGAATRRLDEAAFQVASAASQRAGQPPQSGPDFGGDTAPPAAPAAAPAPTIGAALPSAENPDLPAAMVGMISASNAVLANLQSIRRADEAMDAILKLGA